MFKSTNTREHDTKQDKRSLAEYYAELRAIWPEIDFVEDSKLIMLLKRWSINSRFNKLRFLIFLVVLNQDYDQVRSKIIGRSPFPTLRQAYAALQSEESRRNVMVYNNQQERTAMLIVPQKEMKNQSLRKSKEENARGLGILNINVGYCMDGLIVNVEGVDQTDICKFLIQWRIFLVHLN